MKSTCFFAKTPPLKLFFATSIPGMVSMLASSLYQTIDGVFVGQFLGATAFAAINLAMPFVIINFALADLIGVGSAVPISVCLGKKQGERGQQHLHLQLSAHYRHRCGGRRGAVCRRSPAHPADGRPGGLCPAGHPVFAGCTPSAPL